MNPRHFPDGLKRPAPEDDPVVNLPKFETLAKVKHWQRHRINVLQKGDAQARQLAQELQNCLDGHYNCSSPACPKCARMYRRHLSGMVMTTLREAGHQIGQGFVASVIPHEMAREPGQLATFDPDKANRKTRQRFTRSELYNETSIGAWDFSLNVHQDGLWKPHWQPHLYLAFPFTTDQSWLRRQLKDIFPQSETVPKPIRTERFGDPLRQITYANKWCFFRRWTYTAPNGRQATDKRVFRRRLPEDALRELLVALDQFGWSKRLFLRNARQHGTRLVLLPPPFVDNGNLGGNHD